MREWIEIPFLCQAYRTCFEDCLIDEEFNLGNFEDLFKKKITRIICDWTIIEMERKIILQDLIDTALDERNKTERSI